MLFAGCKPNKPQPIDLEAYVPRDPSAAVVTVASETEPIPTSAALPETQSAEATTEASSEPVSVDVPPATTEERVTQAAPKTETAETEPETEAHEQTPEEWAAGEIHKATNKLGAELLSELLSYGIPREMVISPILVEAQLNAAISMIPEGSESRAAALGYFQTELSQNELSATAHYNVLSKMMGTQGIELGHCLWLDDTVILSDSYSMVETSMPQYGIGIWPTNLQSDTIRTDLDTWCGNVNPSGTLAGIFSASGWLPGEEDQIDFSSIASVSIPVEGTTGNYSDGRPNMTVWADYMTTSANGLSAIRIDYPDYHFGFIYSNDPAIQLEGAFSMLPSVVEDLIMMRNGSAMNGQITFPLINTTVLSTYHDVLQNIGLASLFDPFSANMSVLNSSSAALDSIVQADHMEFVANETEEPVPTDNALIISESVIFFVTSPDGTLIQLGYVPAVAP